MPAFNGNNGYLTINAVNVSGYSTEMGIEASNATVDVTAGFGTEHMQRAAGLNDTKANAVIAYLAGQVATYITQLHVGSEAVVVWGPEGNVSGKPKHQQKFIVASSSGPKQTVKKDMVVFEISFEAADAPIEDMYAGAVFA